MLKFNSVLIKKKHLKNMKAKRKSESIYVTPNVKLLVENISII